MVAWHGGATATGAHPGGMDPNWNFYDEMDERDLAGALWMLKTTAQREPGNLDAINEPYVEIALSEGLSEPKLRDRALDATEALLQAHWEPATFSLDSALYLLAVRSVERGQTEAASAVARSIHDARYVLRLAVDRRFEAAGLNPVAASKADVEREATKAEKSPDSLYALQRYVEALIVDGQAEKALGLADAAIAKARGGRSFADADDRLQSMRNARAHALEVLGRWDEALADIKQAARDNKHGRRDIGQSLTYAAALYRAGAPSEALAELAASKGSRASPHGEALREMVRACAAAQTADRTTVDDAIGKLKTAGDDDAAARVEALVCAGDLDAARQVLIGALANPDSRGAALVYIQQLAAPSNPSPWRRTCFERIAALRASPDVAAAVGRVGRMETWPFPSD